MSRLAAAVAAVALAGCPSYSTLQTPDPVPPGKWQIGGALLGAGLRDTHYDFKYGYPQLELTARRGLGPDLDAGVKLYVAGLEGSVKWRFRRGRWPLALAPALAVAKTREDGANIDAIFLWVHLPLVAGKRLGPRTMLGFGPKLLYSLVVPKDGGSFQGLAAGAFVNLDWRVTGGFHLVPELDLYRTLLGEEPLEGAVAQLGLGLIWEL